MRQLLIVVSGLGIGVGAVLLLQRKPAAPPAQATAAASDSVASGSAAAEPQSMEPSAVAAESANETAVRSELLRVGTTDRQQAVHMVDAKVWWSSGTEGKVLRTVDGGEHWQDRSPKLDDVLQFRDVHGVSAQTAYALSAGLGPASRIYKTVDGGRHWKLQYQGEHAELFLNCVDFWDERRGIVYGDAYDGQLFLLETLDGEHWQRIGPERLPGALPGEGGFAASGTCVRRLSPTEMAIGTGASHTARVPFTADRGKSWKAWATPLVANKKAGVYSVHMAAPELLVAFGGQMQTEAKSRDRAAVLRGPQGNLLASPIPFGGPVYGAAVLVHGSNASNWGAVVVGPQGAAVSEDGGQSWRLLSRDNYWGVDCRARTCVTVGPKGRITRWEFGAGPGDTRERRGSM